jgi:DNA-binding NarL/FixJ family response regulator
LVEAQSPQGLGCGPDYQAEENAMALSRIMVVDDFNEWRRKVCSILEQHQELLVVGEASDGAEAVQKAKELQPDLIVLDIGLPKLDGIKAALRISELSPSSKILFFSQDSDVGTVQAALRTGAWAYVHKLSAGTDLLSAVAALLQGRRFVSNGIGGGEPRRREPKTRTAAPHAEAFVSN